MTCGSRENAATRVADYVDRAEMCKYHSDFYRRVYKTVSFSSELPACVYSVSRLQAAGPISADQRHRSSSASSSPQSTSFNFSKGQFD